MALHLGSVAIGRLAIGQLPPNGFSVLTAALTSYTVSGLAVPLTPGLTAGAGSFVVTGNASIYERDFVNWYPYADPTATWTTEAAPSSLWTNLDAPTTTWTDDDDQSIPSPVVST